MGLITFSVILYLIRTAKQRFGKSGTRLKDTILGEEEESGTTMKDHNSSPIGKNATTQWADVCHQVLSSGQLEK